VDVLALSPRVSRGWRDGVRSPTPGGCRTGSGSMRNGRARSPRGYQPITGRHGEVDGDAPKGRGPDLIGRSTPPLVQSAGGSASVRWCVRSTDGPIAPWTSGRGQRTMAPPRREATLMRSRLIDRSAVRLAAPATRRWPRQHNPAPGYSLGCRGCVFRTGDVPAAGRRPGRCSPCENPRAYHAVKS
jgi:hypothetical protein